jgi:thioredoxin-like negative regulator of GroEL
MALDEEALTDDAEALTEADRQTKKITKRIERVEMARDLAENGNVEKALVILQNVRPSYEDEPAMLRQVDRLIERIKASG